MLKDYIMEEVTLFHPPIVHFAVVLPIVTTILYLIFLKTKNGNVFKMAEYFAYASAIFVVLAWYTGGHDGKLAYEALFMNSDEGVEELKEHKSLGTMLAIFFVAIAVMFKMSQLKPNKYLFWIIGASLLFGSATILKQGKDGGELVYEYAANVELPETEDDEDFYEEE